jgi:hypothetical protein
MKGSTHRGGGAHSQNRPHTTRDGQDWLLHHSQQSHEVILQGRMHTGCIISGMIFVPMALYSIGVVTCWRNYSWLARKPRRREAPSHMDTCFLHSQCSSGRHPLEDRWH